MSDDLKKELEKAMLDAAAYGTGNIKIVQGDDGRIVFETKEKEEK